MKRIAPLSMVDRATAIVLGLIGATLFVIGAYFVARESTTALCGIAITGSVSARGMTRRSAKSPSRPFVAYGFTLNGRDYYAGRDVLDNSSDSRELVRNLAVGDPIRIVYAPGFPSLNHAALAGRRKYPAIWFLLAGVLVGSLGWHHHRKGLYEPDDIAVGSLNVEVRHSAFHAWWFGLMGGAVVLVNAFPPFSALDMLYVAFGAFSLFQAHGESRRVGALDFSLVADEMHVSWHEHGREPRSVRYADVAYGAKYGPVIVLCLHDQSRVTIESAHFRGRHVSRTALFLRRHVAWK